MNDPTPSPRIRRAFDILLFVLFLGAISAPLAVMGLRRAPEIGADAVENRPRIPFPELDPTWESLRTFPDRYEVYVDNQFGLRDLLIRWQSRFSVFVLHLSPSPKVRLGREDWLYFDGDATVDDPSPITDYTGLNPLNPAQLEALRYLYQDQADYLRGLGIHYLLVLAPTKPFLYPEYLPGNVFRAGDNSWREQVVSYLGEHTDVDVLDLGPALQAARNTEPVFFRTDTHWNPVGGFLGATEIVRALQPWFPQLAPKPESLYLRNPNAVKHGDLGRMINLEERFAETYVDLVPGPELTGTNRRLSDNEYPAIVGGNGDPASPTAQVYRDSYAEYLYPFLSEHFRAVRYDWAQKGSRMDGIEQGRPDVVLQVTCDRVLASSLMIAPRIREQASRQRFERARRVARYSPQDGLEGLVVSRNARRSHTQDGLVVVAPNGKATVTLPLDLDAATELPLLRLEIRPETSSLLQVTSPTQPAHRGKRPPEVGLGRFRLEPGRNIFHLTLTDPGIRDHITLDLGPTPGGYLVYTAELRAVPRYAK